MPVINTTIQKPLSVSQFRSLILDYFKNYGRDLPWRNTSDPYHILVSEIMLQQTQVERVKEKYVTFLYRFPTIKSLATAPLSDVLQQWQGLGYNRRAKSLRACAEILLKDFQCCVPSDPLKLVTLPGIGKATAASISAFAFNKPTVFIETNIRSVFIHFFFNNRSDVSDTELLPIVAEALDTRNSTRWYSALMDYGVFLKKHVPNPSRKSTHHVKQSSFIGSDRHIRGGIIKMLVHSQKATKKNLIEALATSDARITPILADLVKENLLVKTKSTFSIA